MKGVKVARLLLELIGHIEIGVFAAIAQSASEAVDGREVQIVGVCTIVIGRTAREKIQESILRHGRRLPVVTRTQIEIIGRTQLGSHLDGADGLEVLLGFITQRFVFFPARPVVVIARITHLTGTVVAVFIFGIQRQEAANSGGHAQIELPRRANLVVVVAHVKRLVGIVGNEVAVAVVVLERRIDIELLT